MGRYFRLKDANVFVFSVGLPLSCGGLIMLHVEKKKSFILICAASTNILFSIKRNSDLVNSRIETSESKMWLSRFNWSNHQNKITRFILFLFCIMWYYYWIFKYGIKYQNLICSKFWIVDTFCQFFFKYNTRYVLLYFYLAWCGLCKNIYFVFIYLYSQVNEFTNFTKLFWFDYLIS